jgi:hypothetical protein
MKNITVDLPANVQLDDSELLDRAQAMLDSVENQHWPRENNHLESELEGDEQLPRDEHLRLTPPIQSRHR